MIIVCLIVGTIVGLSATFLAVGGGIFIVPALVTFLNVPRHQAIATSLAVIFLLSTTNVFRFNRRGAVNWPLGLLIGCFAAGSAFIAASFGLKLSGDDLGLVFVATLALIAFQSFRGDNSKIAKILSAHPHLKNRVAPGLGVFAGVIAALTGVSGGLLVTPYVLASRWVSNERVVPTVTVTMVLTSFSAATSYFLSAKEPNFIRFDAAIIIFAAAVVSSTLGQKYQHRLSRRTRGWLLGVVLLALITQTIFQILKK